MEKKYFKCTLLSNVMLNKSTLPEHNMYTLNYIPGNNFLGIVAGRLGDINDIADLLSGEKVKFGNALISNGKEPSYTVPFSYFMDKLNNNITEKNASIYLHHLLWKNKHKPTDNKGSEIQLQQQRSGFLNTKEEFWKTVETNFALKSAYDSENRKSKDTQMYGFQSLEKGQVFMFSLLVEDNDFYDKKVKPNLVGERKIGKSKSAEYGWVKIEEVNDFEENVFGSLDGKTLVYAESDLCFYAENGQPTYQPTAQQLGLGENDIICWEKSQIRIRQYTPWNGHRNCLSIQRNCIEKGSVFYVEETTTDKKTDVVGEYQAEGLGRVIYNPNFLTDSKEENKLNIEFKEFKSKKTEQEYDELTPLNKFLKGLKNEREHEFKVAGAVHKEIEKHENSFSNISKSQWGNIRSYATDSKDLDSLKDKLFDTENGVLCTGIAYEKQWSKNNDKAIKTLENILLRNKEFGLPFIIKFASEMAKLKK